MNDFSTKAELFDYMIAKSSESELKEILTIIDDPKDQMVVISLREFKNTMGKEKWRWDDTEIKVKKKARIAYIKERWAIHQNVNLANYRFLYAGEVVDDEKTVFDYGIDDGGAIHIIQEGKKKEYAPEAKLLIDKLFPPAS